MAGAEGMTDMRQRALVVAALLLAGPVQAAQDPVYTGRFSNLAVSGYDPVAYFDEGRPVEGDGRWTHDWRGATWRFASQEHLDRFKADPEAFAPRYGGYCAWAVSQGYTASADPEAWRIVDGKLYLNYDRDVQKTWEQDIPGNIAKAAGNWPKVLEK
jgi:YHS domain-containing protein